MRGKNNPILEKNAFIDDSVDIFQMTSKKKVRNDEWDYRLANPPIAEDYEHVCRIPISEISKNMKIFRENIGEMSFAYAMLSRKNPVLQQMRSKYCLPSAKRMKEPDMVCVGGKSPECRFIQNRDPESRAETGGNFSWVHPSTYTKEKMLTGPWARTIYPSEMREKTKMDYRFVA